MTTSAPELLSRQPHLKPATTASSDSVYNGAPLLTKSGAGGRVKPIKPPSEILVERDVSDQAALALIRRVLSPDRPITVNDKPNVSPALGSDLPPLTSSNDVDIQLYALLAVIVKDLVNTWYSRITNDHDFVEEIVQIVAHCSRAVEQRLREIDIPELCLHEIPCLLQQHIEAYKTAKSATTELSYGDKAQCVYHALNPHPALDPAPVDDSLERLRAQQENEAAYRQILIQGALAALLPSEDVQNAPLRILVGDVFADLIVGQALAGKLCEDWFIYASITKLLSIVSDKVQPKTTGSELRDDAKSRLEKFGLLSPGIASQRRDSPSNNQSTLSAWFWSIMQYGYLAFLFLRHVSIGLKRARRLPKRHRHAPKSASPTSSRPPDGTDSNQVDVSPRPVLAYGVFGAISTLLNACARAPWIASMLLFWQQALLFKGPQIGSLNSILDRYLYNLILTDILPPSLVSMILQQLRLAVFPNNALGPPAPPPPTEDQKEEIKREAARAILAMVPKPVAKRYYDTASEDEILFQIEGDILRPFEDAYLNKHLAYGLLELLLVRLIPELETQNVSELFADRGATWGYENDGKAILMDGDEANSLKK